MARRIVRPKHPNTSMTYLTPVEVLHALVVEHPGLVDGEEDGKSGADVVDTMSMLLARLDPSERVPLQGLAKALRDAEAPRRSG